MKLWLTLGILLGLMAAFPALGTAVLGLLGAAAVTVAAQPVVWAFTAGLLARPRLARRQA